MEENTKTEIGRHGPLWTDLQGGFQDDPERLKQIEAIKRVMEENREVLQRLADS
jgi:hypothetical protein